MNEWSRLTITVTARLCAREHCIFIPRRPTALCLTAASLETEKTTCPSCVASNRSILAKGRRRFHDTGKDCDPLDAEIVGAVFRSVSPPIYLYCSIGSIFLPDLEESKQRINYEEAGALISSRESPKHERDSSVELNIEADIIFRKRTQLFVKMARDTWKKLTLSKIIQDKDKNVYASPKIDPDVKPVESCGSPSFSSYSPSSKRLSETKSRLGSMIFNDCNPSNLNIETFRIFVATWNVGGNTPHNGLNLTDDFLPANDHSDIYVLGFQEIVPLNAGNVLVIEDNEPASKWLYLINQALNGSDSATDDDSKPPSPYINPIYYQTSSFTSLGSKASKNQLSSVSKTSRTEQGRLLKACNCPFESSGKYYRESCFRCQSNFSDDDLSEEEEESSSYSINQVPVVPIINRQRYSLIASKQMVGIFVTVWVRSELVQHIGHLRLSCVGRGIMRYLGNKGCISVSMSLHQTTFCFVCSHLASGEKEGDELRRNSDVSEILKHTQFRKVCRRASLRIPVKILDHDYVIWLGDLNYRIALSYAETKKLLEVYNWDALLEKDQLKTEREAGRVFKGWNEGKIYFGPTYKYSNNSDTYAGEIVTSKKKRRTPAWCDRILWHGDGIEQLSYIRGESKFSDHRAVCASFVVEVGVSDRLKNGLSTHNMKVGVEELLPPSTN